MTRFKLTAYIIDFVGFLFAAFYAVGHFVKESHARQLATGFQPKISVQEGSFWLTTNTDPFMYPGIALLVIGMSMIYYDAMKTMKAKNKSAE
jgi:hypothetical protein